DKRGRSMRKAVQAVKSALQHCPRETTVVLQAHRSVRSSLLAHALHFYTITYDESRFGFLADKRVPRVAVLHETQRIGLLLEPLGARREDLLQYQPSLTKVASTWLDELLSPIDRLPLIAIAPGSVWGTKRWPVEYFIQLGRILLTETGCTLVILGSQDEMAA